MDMGMVPDVDFEAMAAEKKDEAPQTDVVTADLKQEVMLGAADSKEDK